MPLLMKSALLLFLCFSAVVSISKWSARWDTHLDHLRSKRQQVPAGCTWERYRSSYDEECTLQGLMDNDALGRRASGLLATPQYQGECGSCWAFAATHVYTDTLSIMAGRATTPLSPQYPASCFTDTEHVGDGNGCCGSVTLEAGFVFFKNTGAVPDSCAPYSSVLRDYPDNEKPDSESLFNTCPNDCIDGTTFNPNTRRILGYRKLTSEAEVIQALADGPVLAGILIPYISIFGLYKCGIFCETAPFGEMDGGHAVEIVDYGTKDEVDFWVMKDSYGLRKEGGYFRIRRGDMGINEFGYLVPVLTPGGVTSSALTSFSACAVTEVTTPTENELVMSAVDVTIDEINELNSIPCPDGSTPNMVVLRTVAHATTQLVDGRLFDLELLVDIMGCSTDQRAQVESNVKLEAINNTFEVNIDRYTYVGSSGAGSFTNCVATILFTLAIIVLLVI